MKTWIYLINCFLTASENSFRAAKKIGDFTLAALDAHKADPAILALFTSFKPFVVDYDGKYVTWVSQLGLQKGDSNELTFDFIELRGDKARAWDIAVQNVYAEGTTEYVKLFPNHRIPFQHGSQEDRIAAVGALSIAIGADLLLTTVKTDVDAFFVKITKDFNDQKGSISTTGTSSDEVEASRVKMCVEQYGVLGTLMSLYKLNPKLAEQFFDLETIRNHEQSIFKHGLKGGESRVAITHTFAADEQVRLVNRGNTKIKFATVAEANDPISVTFIEVNANDEQIVTAQQLGAITNRFLKAENTSATEKTAYTIMLV